MTKAIPVSTATLAGKSWRRSSNYRFAADKIICPIDYTEVPKASLSMPLAFLKSAQGFHLVAIHGLLKDTNLYVAPDGRWLADYVPFEYRLYPFSLAQVEDGRSILCVDEDSGLISDSDDATAFFDDDKPTELVTNVFNALTAHQSQLAHTGRILNTLSYHGLIKEWDLTFKINDAEQKVGGLYCVDETAIAGLTGGQLVALRDSGALALMYCQMLSMHQIQYLLKLLKVRASQKPATVNSLAELNLDGSSADSGTLNFDNL